MAGNKKNSNKMPDRKAVHTQYKKLYPKYRTVLGNLHRKINSLISKKRVNANIKSRVKPFESFFAKLLKQHGSEQKPPELNDLLGIRIICPFLEDLDEIEVILNDSFNVVEIERKGLKHSFREFGYDSIHLLIDLSDKAPPSTIPFTRPVCEIQLRTILQEAWAEIEHDLIYKSDFSILNDSIKRKLASLNATLTLSDIIFQEIRDYQKEIQSLDEQRKGSLQDKVDLMDELSILDSVKDAGLAKKLYKPAKPIKPQNQIEKLIFQALDAHSNGKFDRAIKIYSQILRMKLVKQVRSVIYNHRGMAYFVLSEYSRAVSDFSRALEYNDGNFSAYNNRGLVFRVEHKYEAAIEEFNKSLKLNECQVQAYHIRALTYYDLHDYARALEDCQMALNIKPDFIPAQKLKIVIGSRIGI